MKQIELKSFQLQNRDRKGEPLFEDGKPITSEVFYKDLIKNALDNVPKEGLGVNEMRERIKILDKLDEAKNGKVLELDDSELDTVHRLLQQMRYTVVEKGLLEFADYIAKVRGSE